MTSDPRPSTTVLPGPSVPAGARAASPHSAIRPPDQDWWEAYCDYLLACVQAEDRQSGARLEDPRGWHPLDVNLIVATDATPSCPPDLVTAARAEASSLRVGWPVLALPDNLGVRLVPLLVLDVDLTATDSTGGGTPHLVALDDQPTVNPQLADSRLGLDPSDVAAAHAVASGPVDATALELAQAVADALGLACPPLDGPPHPPTEVAGLQHTVLVETLEGTSYTQALRRELADLRHRTDWPGTVAGMMLRGTAETGDVPTQDPNAQVATVAAPVPLNDSQLDAVIGMERPLSVITGPPGTGKSQVVTAVAATAWLRAWSTLIASTNNAAVDVAAARLRATHPVLALRSGNREHRQQLARTAGELLRQPAPQVNLPRARSDLDAAFQQVRALVDDAAARSRLHQELLAACLDLDAHDDVLVDRHARLPAGEATKVTAVARITRKGRVGFFRRRRMARLRRELGLRTQAAPTQLHAWAQAWLRVHELKELENTSAPAATPEQMADAEAAWQQASTAVLQGLAAEGLRTRRSTLQRLADDRARRPLAHAEDLQALRGWAVTALSAAATLPLQAGIVDVLVLDEASVCSVAHVLPLAYRARRAVVLGDPNQLRPVVRLDERAEAAAAASARLDVGDLVARDLSFRSSTAYDAFARAAGDVNTLTEHYRCHPEVAEWFNRQFYGGSLTVLTRVDPLARRGIETIPVRGESARGSRRGSWVNRAEADQVVSLAAGLVTDGSSLGVVTPYAAQADLIDTLLRDELGSDFVADRDVAVATAHRFQGSERDVIVLSTVVTPDTPIRSARWLEQERRLLNVAASRARRLLVVVGHPDAAAAHDLSTLASLWQATTTSATETDPPDAAPLTESESRLWEVFDDTLGTLRPRERVDGYPMDFAWTTPWGMQVAVEVDDDTLGRPPRRRREDLERDRVLHSLGWQVVRVPGWYCYDQPVAAVDGLQEVLARVETTTTTEVLPPRRQPA